MKVVKSYSALTICSDLTVEQIEQAAKFAPEALTLFEKVENKKIPVFKLKFDRWDNPELSEFGVSFNAFNEDHQVYATLLCSGVANDDNRSAEQQKQQILECFAKQLAQLKQIEEQVIAALAAKAELIASVEDCVEVQA